MGWTRINAISSKYKSTLRLFFCIKGVSGDSGAITFGGARGVGVAYIYLLHLPPLQIGCGFSCGPCSLFKHLNK